MHIYQGVFCESNVYIDKDYESACIFLWLMAGNYHYILGGDTFGEENA